MRVVVSVLAISLIVANPARAVFEDDAPPSSTETTEKCSGEKIFDEETRKCVDANHQSFNDATRYAAIRELAYAGAYERALAVLATVDDPADPRFLNYRGFIARKMGNVDEAMTFYLAAIEKNPNYLLARSYMGQGLVGVGDFDGAKAQLREINARGGKNTWAYFALRQAIRTGPSSGY